jgi:glutathione S-transferase
MKLLSNPISPNGKRVKICATELGIPLTPQLVDFAKGDHRSADYLALNPMGKIPTLVEDGFVLWESPAILHYLAQQVPGSPVWPASARGQSDMLRWMFFGAAHVDPYLTTLLIERHLKARDHQPADEHVTAAAEQQLARFLPVIEQQLNGRDYLAGGFGLADITLGCALELAPMLRLDLSPYPRVLEWLARLQSRESWRNATAA